MAPARRLRTDRELLDDLISDAEALIEGIRRVDRSDLGSDVHFVDPRALDTLQCTLSGIRVDLEQRDSERELSG